MRHLIIGTLIGGALVAVAFGIYVIQERVAAAQLIELTRENRALSSELSAQMIQLHEKQVEKTCVELGLSARRGLKNDRDTELFEGLGCCYNDGKPEPAGC